jgi:hypothetical protein
MKQTGINLRRLKVIISPQLPQGVVNRRHFILPFRGVGGLKEDEVKMNKNQTAISLIKTKEYNLKSKT